jgi:lysophospholipase L1-like esterase
MKLISRLLLVTAWGLFATAVVAQPSPPPKAASHFSIPDTDDGLPGTGPIRRYDWFRKLWLERRSTWAQHVQQDQNAVVFLGDSITQGWGDGMGGSFPGVKLANRGISGDTTRGVLIRLQEDVLSLHPSAVVILIGTNDLEEQADPETTAANLRLILAELKKHNAKMPIILCQVFPSSDTKKRPADKIKKINQLYAAAVKGDSQITLLETWPLFADSRGDAIKEEFPDLLHPNQAGYAKWAAALRPIFATLGFLETESDTFTPEPGFVSLFNGRDLTGWGYRPTSDADIQAAKRWQSSDTNAAAWPIVTKSIQFDGQTSSDDGRYVAKSGRLIVTTPPEGRKIQALWTTREFPKDFVLKLDFRATPNTDSGIFIRQPQLQCRDYLIAGPYKQLKQYKAQDWNEIVVTVKGGEAHCTCNDEILEAAMKIPATGPIGLEGDRGQMEYRRIRLQELP